MGLGFACQDLLTRIGVDNLNPEGSSSRLEEMMLVRNIIRTLSMALSQLCPSASDSLRNIHENFLIGGDDTFSEEFLNFPYQDSNNVEEDAWGIAGLVLGFGNSVVAIYRSGDYDAVLKIKEMLMSWVPQVDSSLQSFIFCREMSEVPLSMGACLVLPTVIAFCRRTELKEDDSDLVYRYGSLISALMSSKKSGALYQNLMMASCVGAGSLLSCTFSDGMHSVRVDDAKYLLGILRDTYTRSCHPSVHLGGMLGVVNAFGASAGVVTRVYPMTTSSQLDNEQDSSCIMGSLLSSPIWESLITSIIQELFLLAKESRDQQIKQYAAWAISFLREKWWSKELQNISSQVGSAYPKVSSQNFAEDSLVMKLCLWLGDVDVTKSDMVMHTSTVSTVLRCLSKAPRLPTLEWGAIIRRSMRYGAKTLIPEVQCPESLREECIRFSLAHANNFSPLLLFLDELTDLSRFGTLELNLKCTLLHHLPDLLKIFSGSRLDKLSEDLVAYFSSSGSSYFSYDLDQRTLLRVSFWKGLHQCLNGTLKEPMHTSRIEKCMQCLFSSLPVLTCYARMEAQVPDGIEEWSAAMRCFSKASQGWLMDVLQVSNIDKFHEGTHVDEVVKQISARARLVKIGRIPISEMDKIKAYILNTRLEGSWWNVLMDVAATVSTAEGNTKIHWLLDALDISCIAEYPSTALRFVGLLSGCCCKYMPLLLVDPETVLSDLPVTLPSLLLETRWNAVVESAANKLWATTERICTWALQVAGNEDDLHSQGSISSDEAPNSAFLARILYQTCVSLKDYLPVQKQLRLANLEISKL